MAYTNVLQIRHEGKSVLYAGAGVLRSDGDANYGFKALKNAPARLAEVPELERDPALHDLVAAINHSTTGLFSVGCVSGPVEEVSGHRMMGYVEIALNSKDAAADAASYFPIFFHFDRMLNENRYDDDVHFHWELMGAHFIEAQLGGFTVTVTINTGWFETPEAARAVWGDALQGLAHLLSSVPASPGRNFY